MTVLHWLDYWCVVQEAAPQLPLPPAGIDSAVVQSYPTYVFKAIAPADLETGQPDPCRCHL